MIETGCDIAWEKPTGKQLADAGIRFASLYVGQDKTGKNMTPDIVADYAAHGVWINTNFEYGAQQMLGGAKQGGIDAKLGLAQATACGMPPKRPISYSADWDATTAEINGSIIPYLVAARSVTGPGTVGVYGSYAVVTAVAAYWAAHFPGERIHLWQTVAWSKSAWYAADEVRQPGGTITVGGIAIDLDYADVDDFGQWMPGLTPLAAKPAVPATAKEPEMILVNTSGSAAVLAVSGSLVWGVQDGTSSAAYQAKGVPLVTVSAAEFAAIQTAAANAHGAVTVPVTIDSSQLTTALVAAESDPALLATEGAAIAHAEAVEQHKDTPAS